MSEFVSSMCVAVPKGGTGRGVKHSRQNRRKRRDDGSEPEGRGRHGRPETSATAWRRWNLFRKILLPRARRRVIMPSLSNSNR
jgi:hypothetical protein